MAIPQENASLTKVERGGTHSEDDAWTDAEAPTASTVWTGAEAAYYQEKRERVEGLAENLFVRRSLIVGEGEPVVEWESGMTVTFAYAGKTYSRVPVQNVERRVFPLAGPLQTTRLSLAPG